jgi:hypothetical protein
MFQAPDLLDFVAAWYRKAADYMAENPKIKAAFVSTNSITQGEQVGVLWPDLFKRGVKIHFAHRTFQWSSEARGKAAVHCVIIGFALHDTEDKRIFDYEVRRPIRTRSRPKTSTLFIGCARYFSAGQKCPALRQPHHDQWQHTGRWRQSYPQS